MQRKVTHVTECSTRNYQLDTGPQMHRLSDKATKPTKLDVRQPKFLIVWKRTMASLTEMKLTRLCQFPFSQY